MELTIFDLLDFGQEKEQEAAGAPAEEQMPEVKAESKAEGSPAAEQEEPEVLEIAEDPEPEVQDQVTDTEELSDTETEVQEEPADLEIAEDTEPEAQEQKSENGEKAPEEPEKQKEQEPDWTALRVEEGDCAAAKEKLEWISRHLHIFGGATTGNYAGLFEHLKGRCDEDGGFAEDVLQEHKTASRFMSYIMGQARELAKTGEGMFLTDDTVFEWGEDYFRKDDTAEIEAEKAKKEAAEKKSDEKKAGDKDKKVKKKAPKKPEPEEEFHQIDLMGLLNM